MNSIGIIGGSGLYQLATDAKEIVVETPFGSVKLYETIVGKKTVFFLPRHGINHHLPPHKINYRANIFALYHQRAQCILSTAAVGSLNPSFEPGMFGYAGQFIDFTKKRADTFFDDFSNGIKHADMTNPYHPALNELLKRILSDYFLPFLGPLTMVVTEGPRFESPAEIKAYQSFGADVVGMTGYPEVALAREMEIPFACLAISTNFAAGVSKEILSHEEVVEQMKHRSNDLLRVITRFIELV